MIKPKETHKKEEFSAEEYVQGLANGDINILGRAITLVESTKAEHQALAQKILEQSRARSLWKGSKNTASVQKLPWL